jgi:fatty acid desaturase
MNPISTVQPSIQGRAGDTFAGEVPVKLTRDELRELSTINPIRSWLHIGGEWAAIIGTIWFSQRFWNPLLYLVAVAIIGARQHALLILMHDGVHYRLFRNRRFNDWVSELLLAWPNLISARAYRRNHFAHHRYLNTAQDPDWARRQGDAAWVFPKHWSELARMLLRDLSGLGAIAFLRLARMLLTRDTGVNRRFNLARYGFYLIAAAVLVWAGMAKIVVLYWFVPLFTWLIMIFRLRSIAEHSAIQPGNTAYAQTRTTYVSLLERLFVAPKNVNYHLEHHFYPSVPFYRLPALHRTLLTKPGFADSAHLSPSYFGVLTEATGANPAYVVDAARSASSGSAPIRPVAEVAR